jgi:hypothetical protein
MIDKSEELEGEGRAAPKMNFLASSVLRVSQRALAY